MAGSTELATVEDVSAVAARTGVAGVVSYIMDAATQGTVDAAVLTAMTQMATSLKAEERLDVDRQQRAEFNRDLNAAIMEMPVITRAGIIVIPAKDGNPERTQGRFARYEDIDRVVRPILLRHNLSVRFDIGEANGKVTVKPIIGHRNGTTWAGEGMSAPLDTSGAKNNVQGAGSTVTYLKRYTLCAVLNIVTEGTDDDGSLGKFEIGMTHEREVTVLEGGEAAALEGTYAAWFVRQSPKDRAWMVKAGHHARLGGGLALPGTEAPETIARPQAAATGAQRGNQGGGGGRMTAKAWTEKYEQDCKDAADIDALREVQERGAEDLGRLKDANATLYDRAVQAGTDALARLSGGEI